MQWQAPTVASFAQPAMQSVQICSSFYYLKKDYGHFCETSVKAETHVMLLHTTRKSVTATPTSVTDTQTTKILIIDCMSHYAIRENIVPVLCSDECNINCIHCIVCTNFPFKTCKKLFTHFNRNHSSGTSYTRHAKYIIVPQAVYNEFVNGLTGCNRLYNKGN